MERYLPKLLKGTHLPVRLWLLLPSVQREVQDIQEKHDSDRSTDSDESSDEAVTISNLNAKTSIRRYDATIVFHVYV